MSTWPRCGWRCGRGWTACRGRGRRRRPRGRPESPRPGPLPRGGEEKNLSESHTQHFLDRRHSIENFLKRVLPEGLHALGGRHLADLGRGRIAQDEIADLLSNGQDLVDGDATLHAGHAARLTTLALVEVHLAAPLGDMAVRHEELLIGFIRLLAFFADPAAEALG